MTYKIFRLIFVVLNVLIIFNIESVAQDYYPLQIGNRWDYQRTYWAPGYSQEIDTFSVEVIDDSLFQNGETYLVLNRFDLTGGKYVRADSSFICYYDEANSEEDTLYRLNAHEGEEWTLQFGAISYIRLDSIATSQIFSISTILQYYRLDGLILSYVTLSDKFGPTYFHSPGEPPGTSFTGISLIGCLIDSIQYGTPVKLENEMNFVTGYFLNQNYPNPFNPSTTIRFDIPERSVVTVKVYDVLGNAVATLFNEEKPAGSYEVEFSVGQDSNPDIASGIYFYRLQAGSFIETKKMLLLK